MLAGKLAIVAIVFWFVRGTVFTALEKLGEHRLQVSSGWLVLSAGLYTLGLLPAALFWRHVMRTLGQDARLGETLRAYYIGHLGKYVPGKAMVVVLRTGLIRGDRVATGVAAASVFFETLAMMSVGAMLAAAILAVWFRQQIALCLVAVGLMALAGVPILPPVFRRLARLAGVGRSDPAAVEQLGRLGWRTLLWGIGSMALVWCCLGVSLWAVLRAMGVESDLLAELPLQVASVALATVAGFLSLIPGGAVVRELILAELMVPAYGDVIALLSAVLLRLVWLAAELAISGVLYVAGWRRGDSRRPAG